MAKKKDEMPPQLVALVGAHGYAQINAWIRPHYLRERAEKQLGLAKQRLEAFE